LEVQEMEQENVSH